MIKDAERLKQEDEKNMKRVEAKNSLESYIYNWRNQMDNKEIADKNPTDEEIQDKAQAFLEAVSIMKKGETVYSDGRIKVSMEASKTPAADPAPAPAPAPAATTARTTAPAPATVLAPAARAAAAATAAAPTATNAPG